MWWNVINILHFNQIKFSVSIFWLFQLESNFPYLFFALHFSRLNDRFACVHDRPIQIIDLRNNKRMIKFLHLIRTNETKIKRIDTMMCVQVLGINRKKSKYSHKIKRKKRRKMRVCNYGMALMISHCMMSVCVFRVVFFFVLNFRCRAFCVNES